MSKEPLNVQQKRLKKEEKHQQFTGKSKKPAHHPREHYRSCSVSKNIFQYKIKLSIPVKSVTAIDHFRVPRTGLELTCNRGLSETEHYEKEINVI